MERIGQPIVIGEPGLHAKAVFSANWEDAYGGDSNNDWETKKDWLRVYAEVDWAVLVTFDSSDYLTYTIESIETRGDVPEDIEYGLYDLHVVYDLHEGE